MFKNLLAVGLGGALGSLLRYRIAAMLNFSEYPLGTLTVNLIGSFLLGFLVGGYFSGFRKEWLRLGLGVGLLGGFTTMSTFSSEVRTIWLAHPAGLATGYTLLSVLGGVLLAACGLFLGHTLQRKHKQS